MNAENQELLYVDLNAAAIMSDRSSRTVYNWIQAGKIEAKKEDENNERSKWLILRSSLMGYLATEVKSDPPRKTGSNQNQSESPIIESTQSEVVEIQVSNDEENPTVSPSSSVEMVPLSSYETLRTDMKLQQASYETKLLELQKANALLQQKLEQATLQKDQKDEMIDFLKQMQPSIEGMRSEYEKRIETLTIKVYETEKELSIVSERYAQECSKGILARIFTRPQEFKLLTDSKS